MIESASGVNEPWRPAMTRAHRRFARCLGVATVGLAVIGMFVTSLVAPAFIVSYKTYGNVLWVGYAPPGECNQMITINATESDDAVVVDIVGWDPIKYLPQTAEQALCTAKFVLKQPLGDRELRTGDGQTVAKARVAR